MFSITIPSTTTTAATQKQIAVQGTNTASVVLYTVPTGRKFIGSFAPEVMNNCRITINGVAVMVSILQTSGSVTSAIPVTLVAGTVIMSVGSPYACGLFGVESDA